VDVEFKQDEWKVKPKEALLAVDLLPKIYAYRAVVDETGSSQIIMIEWLEGGVTIIRKPWNGGTEQIGLTPGGVQHLRLLLQTSRTISEEELECPPPSKDTAKPSKGKKK